MKKNITRILSDSWVFVYELSGYGFKSRCNLWWNLFAKIINPPSYIFNSALNTLWAVLKISQNVYCPIFCIGYIRSSTVHQKSSSWALNVNWTYIRRAGRLLNVFSTFNLMSRVQGYCYHALNSSLSSQFSTF